MGAHISLIIETLGKALIIYTYFVAVIGHYKSVAQSSGYCALGLQMFAVAFYNMITVI